MTIKIQTNLGLISKDELTLRKDGNIFTAYLPDMVDGKYVPDMVKEQKLIDAKALNDFKRIRQLALDTARVEFTATSGTIIYNSDLTENRTLTTSDSKIGFDANEVSQGRIDKARNRLKIALADLSTYKPLNWVLYDNTIITNVTYEIMNSIYIKSTDLMADLWMSQTIEDIYALVSSDLEWKQKFDLMNGE